MAKAKLNATKKDWYPTFGSSTGLLVGATVGAAIGLVFERESAVMTCYIVGAIAGSTAGAFLGFRCSADAKAFTA